MKFKIVYLDDEPELCEIFTDTFSSDKIEVVSFIDPFRAIDHVLRKPPNLIFLDHRLPRTNGDEVAKAMGKDIPKVLVSGDISSESTYEFVAVLRKPYSRNEVQEIIDKFLITQ